MEVTFIRKAHWAVRHGKRVFIPATKITRSTSSHVYGAAKRAGIDLDSTEGLSRRDAMIYEGSLQNFLERDMTSEDDDMGENTLHRYRKLASNDDPLRRGATEFAKRLVQIHDKTNGGLFNHRLRHTRKLASEAILKERARNRKRYPEQINDSHLPFSHVKYVR